MLIRLGMFSDGSFPPPSPEPAERMTSRWLLMNVSGSREMCWMSSYLVIAQNGVTPGRSYQYTGDSRRSSAHSSHG